jgi:hypothetical protein
MSLEIASFSEVLKASDKRAYQYSLITSRLLSLHLTYNTTSYYKLSLTFIDIDS